MSRVRMHPAKQVPKFHLLVKLEEGAALTPPLVERRVKGHNVSCVPSLRESVETHFTEEGTCMC